MHRPLHSWLFFGFFLLFASVVAAQTAPLKTIDEVLAAFLEVNGGEEGIAEVRSIRALGSVTINGKTQALTLLRKRPDLKRISVRMEDFTIHRGFNGEVSWRLIEADDGRKQLTLMEGEEKDSFELDQSILGRLFMKPEDGVKSTLVGVEYVGRIPAYVIDSTFRGDVRRAFLDSRTFRVLKYEYTTEGKKVAEILSNYTRAGKVWIAQRSERVVDGEFDGTVELNRIEINNGVFATVFEVPEVPAVD